MSSSRISRIRGVESRVSPYLARKPSRNARISPSRAARRSWAIAVSVCRSSARQDVSARFRR
jgi:hypothetical protein